MNLFLFIDSLTDKLVKIQIDHYKQTQKLESSLENAKKKIYLLEKEEKHLETAFENYSEITKNPSDDEKVTLRCIPICLSKLTDFQLYRI